MIKQVIERYFTRSGYPHCLACHRAVGRRNPARCTVAGSVVGCATCY
jgi:hypothetical protein